MGLIKRIKSSDWFFGVRREESIFFYSMKIDGERKYLPKMNLPFVDRLLIESEPRRLIRVMHKKKANSFFQKVKSRLSHQTSRVSGKSLSEGSQIKSFTAKTQGKIFGNIKIFKKNLELDLIILNKLESQSANFKRDFVKQKTVVNLDIFKRLVDLYQRHSALFYFNFAAGSLLTNFYDRQRLPPTVKKVLALHDKWRNFVACPEEAFGANIYFYLTGMFAPLNLKRQNDFLVLTATEIFGYLENQRPANLKKLIANRQKGLIFYANRKTDEIITNNRQIASLLKYFTGLMKLDLIGEKLKGMVAFANDKKLTGEAQVISEFSDDKVKIMTGKILVTWQTIPQIMPYLKNVKAIVTEEGGITCHAAIISREMKIPCIVGVKNICKLIKTGQQIELDLKTGEINIF